MSVQYFFFFLITPEIHARTITVNPTIETEMLLAPGTATLLQTYNKIT